MGFASLNPSYALSTSLRGALLSAEARLRAKADATKQSIFSLLCQNGLLRGACHRARIRATRWLAMTMLEIIQSFRGDDYKSTTT
jgi:hypothetical protein